MPSDLDHDYYFQNNEDAAQKLIETLPLELLQNNETVVIGVSEGGVYYADRIAKKLDAQMDILLTEPIMAPNNPELAIAMVSETEEVIMHKALIDAFGINEDFIYSEAKRKYEEEVLSYVYRYRKGKDLLSLKGKYVVLADECIETGLTMMVALKSVIEREAKNIYIATPILDRAVYKNLLTVCDGVFCPYKIRDYISIEYYYKDFEPLDFEEICEIVKQQEIKSKKTGMPEHTIK
ncbi:phosphoribosyltransferase [Sulfurovum sp.]|jgi:putative phosphoribosyl transferase|uniref:phosphoribosyltransferase n=1 Tax=Sulfurovum sp. TaxID=1969726 RepID=UPI0025EDFB28|nr:phosphoribosyltransferase family protein [Sulfurovum sp.]